MFSALCIFLAHFSYLAFTLLSCCVPLRDIHRLGQDFLFNPLSGLFILTEDEAGPQFWT